MASTQGGLALPVNVVLATSEVGLCTLWGGPNVGLKQAHALLLLGERDTEWSLYMSELFFMLA